MHRYVKILRLRPRTFWIIQRYVDFNLSFGRGMRFYRSDRSKILQKCINYYNQPWSKIIKTSIKNLLRYLDICSSVDFNHSFGQGMRSIEEIDLIFKRNLYFIIIHIPAKFHKNRLRTFWVKSESDKQTHTDRYTPVKIIPLHKQSFWAR